MEGLPQAGPRLHCLARWSCTSPLPAGPAHPLGWVHCGRSVDAIGRLMAVPVPVQVA